MFTISPYPIISWARTVTHLFLPVAQMQKASLSPTAEMYTTYTVCGDMATHLFNYIFKPGPTPAC